MDTPTFNRVLSILRKELHKWKLPAVGAIAEQAVDRPFETLVSTILSLRTKDAVTAEASRRLLACAPTPETIASLPVGEIEQLIFPVGFYHTKSKHLQEACRRIMRDHGGRVPRSMDGLLKLPGVGRKTAIAGLTWWRVTRST
jgi:endonuclease III